MTNGVLADQPGVVQLDGPERDPRIPAFDLSKLTYGDIRRFHAVDEYTPDGQSIMDGILEKVVVGGLDAIPIIVFKATIAAFSEAVNEAMMGKDQPAVPS